MDVTTNPMVLSGSDAPLHTYAGFRAFCELGQGLDAPSGPAEKDRAVRLTRRGLLQHFRHDRYDQALRQVERNLQFELLRPYGTGNTRRASLVDGPALAGKSHLVLQAARRHVLRELESPTRRPHGDFEHAPAAYVSIDTETTYKELFRKLCQFFVPGLGGRMTAEDYWRQFDHQVRMRGTSLVVIDDVHMLRRTDAASRTPAYALKSMLESMQVTVLATAVDGRNIEGLTKPGRYTSPQAIRQIRSRLLLVDLPAYRPDVADDVRSWCQLVVDIEDRLGLADHSPNDLRGMAIGLLERLDGSPGLLVDVLLRAANRVLNSSGADPARREAITRSILEPIVELTVAASDAG